MEKEVAKKLISVCESLTQMLEEALKRYPHLTEESIKEAEALKKEVERHASELTGYLVSKSSTEERGRDWGKPFLAIASNFDRIGFNIDGVLDRLKRMVHEDIYFSDRGIREVSDVARETIDLLKNLPDLITTQNRLLAEQIKEKGKALFKTIDIFSEEHEQRLIEGVCMPKSAPIYLGLLESFKAMTFHVLEISERVVSLKDPLEP